MIQISKPLFNPGRILATPGCLELFTQTGQNLWEFLSRHLSGDWGVVDTDDKAANDEALKDGSRLLSAYVLKNGEKIWIITEAEDESGHRVCSTAIRPVEY